MTAPVRMAARHAPGIRDSASLPIGMTFGHNFFGLRRKLVRTTNCRDTSLLLPIETSDVSPAPDLFRWVPLTALVQLAKWSQNRSDAEPEDGPTGGL